MAKKDKRVDAYIAAKAQPFARPILTRFGRAVHAACKAFSPSAQREYVEWLTGATSDETRDRRLETAIEWMAEGKSRNWKYVR